MSHSWLPDKVAGMLFVRRCGTAMFFAVLMSSGGCFAPDDAEPGPEAVSSGAESSDRQEVAGTPSAMASTTSYGTSSGTGMDAVFDVEEVMAEESTAMQAAEVCGDDGCECSIGDLRRCSEGGYGGPCADGWQTCNLDGSWSTLCSIAPRPEDTCEPGNDDDCDGVANEGCPCTAGTTRSCSDEGYVGPCADGTQTCSSEGTWGDCSIAPQARDGCTLGNKCPSG